uniref:Uncharacterized protein n=1 Tax=Ditylenchus dipsaci TaxID=166011 RepID=A0A915ERP7_9BILA
MGVHQSFSVSFVLDMVTEQQDQVEEAFFDGLTSIRNEIKREKEESGHEVGLNRIEEADVIEAFRRGTQVEPAPFKWPPNSPDFTPCDFFLWGYLKSRIYRIQPADLNELRARIVHEFEVLPGEMVLRSIDSYVRRLERCVEVEGRSVEQSYADVRN